MPHGQGHGQGHGISSNRVCAGHKVTHKVTLTMRDTVTSRSRSKVTQGHAKHVSAGHKVTAKVTQVTDQGHADPPYYVGGPGGSAPGRGANP